MDHDTLPVIAVFSTASWVAWLLFSSIRRYKVAQLQTEIQGRLLQRFDSSEALLGYTQSDAGKQFIKCMDIERSTPYSQILKGVQAGIVFIFFGAGLLRLHAWNIGDEGPLVFGTLALALGLGFGVAAAVSYFLSPLLWSLEPVMWVAAKQDARPALAIGHGWSEESSAMDEPTFHALYAATAKPLGAYIQRVCGRPDVANDLLQETYCRFLTAQRGNMELADAKSYLFRIATNLLNDRWRKGENAAWCEPAEIGCERDLDTQIDVRDLMQQLKPRERQLLWLAYVEGMTHSEIAKSTGLHSMSVRILLLRARRRAAELLKRKERAVHEV